MPKQFSAGDLVHRVAFATRKPESDGYGNTEGAFVDRYPVWAALIPKVGGEAVQAARLSGVQPYNLTVRDSPEMRQVTTDWRARHLADCPCGRSANELYNIRSGPIDPFQTRQWLEMTVDAGGASG